MLLWKMKWNCKSFGFIKINISTFREFCRPSYLRKASKHYSNACYPANKQMLHLQLAFVWKVFVMWMWQGLGKVMCKRVWIIYPLGHCVKGQFFSRAWLRNCVTVTGLFLCVRCTRKTNWIINWLINHNVHWLVEQWVFCLKASDSKFILLTRRETECQRHLFLHMYKPVDKAEGVIPSSAENLTVCLLKKMFVIE